MHHHPNEIGAYVFMTIMVLWLGGMAIAARRHNRQFDSSGRFGGK